VSLPPQVLRDATTGGPPRLRTAVRAGVRDGRLIVRFDARDDGIVATLSHRDDALWSEDVCEVFLTPLDPPVAYFEFEINPLGALFDARVESPDLVRATMKVDVSWNLPGLSGVSRVRPGRWSAVMKIPLAPLVGDSNALTPALSRRDTEQTMPRPWRANFYRVDRGAKDEFSAWAPTGRDPADFHEPRKFGRLRLPEVL